MTNPVRWLMRVPVPWVFVLAFVAGLIVKRITGIGVLSGQSDLIGRIAGIVLFTTGAVIAGSGLTIFHGLRTTTVPGQCSLELVTWGPYRFTRNPMYVGLTLAYLGEVGILGHLWPLALLPLVLAYLNWMVIPVEEARLTETFGGEYEAYRGRVRRWI
jgi:protein-S-isoprenylcysteine O-methyltransferase Ste14